MNSQSNTENRGAEVQSGSKTRQFTRSSRNSRIPNASPVETGAERAAKLPSGSNWPELRIGRQVDFRQDFGWNLFLNYLGNKNRRIGDAYPLGQVACHYITDREMQTMILKKRPLDNKDNKPTKKLYYDIKESVTDLISRTSQEVMEVEKYLNLSEDFTIIGERPRSKRETDKGMPYIDLMVSLADQGQVFAGYDRNKIGINLSDRPGFKIERNAIISHLETEHGLDISYLRKDWEPHAVIFETKPHIVLNNQEIKYPTLKEAPIPDSILFFAPSVDFSRRQSQ